MQSVFIAAEPANALATAVGGPPNRITAILKDERGLVAQRFSKTLATFWMNPQMTYNLRNAEKACRRDVESELVNTQARPLVLRVHFFSAPARPLGKFTLTAAIENG